MTARVGAFEPSLVPVTRPSTTFELRHASTARVLTVVVPDRRFIAIEGIGPARAGDFDLATATLRAVERNLRERLPRDRLTTRAQAVLEIAWWLLSDGTVDALAAAFLDPAMIHRVHWRQMVEVPAAARDGDVAAAIEVTRRAAGRAIPLVRPMHLEEGFAAQILHVPGAHHEAEAILSLARYALEAGLEPSGPVHQLCLRRVDQVRLGEARSIFRLPLRLG